MRCTIASIDEGVARLSLAEFMEFGWPLLFTAEHLPGRVLLAIPESRNEGEAWVACVVVASTTPTNEQMRTNPPQPTIGEVVAVDLDATVCALDQVEPLALVGVTPEDVVLEHDGDEA